MIPEPTAEDLVRDAETDYGLCLNTSMTSALGEYTPEETLQWIRRAVAAERERDELRIDVERLNQMLRDSGYGQGSIDAYTAQCEELDRLRVEVERLRAFCLDLRKSIEGGGVWLGNMVGDLHLDLVAAMEGPK